MEAEQQQGQKTVVAFISGLLIGGLLMWVFGAEPKTDGAANVKKDADTADVVATDDVDGADVSDGADAPDAPVVSMGDGSISIKNKAVGKTVALGDVTYPADSGWIAVHRMDGENLAGVIGAARFAVKEGLTPKMVELFNATLEAGSSYAVVFHKTDGDRTYSSKTDTVMAGADGKFLGTTFKAE